MNSLLEANSWYLSNPEPTMIVPGMSFGFAPAGAFVSKMVIKSGDSAVSEMKFRDSSAVRTGVFALVSAASPRAISLGNTNGPRSLEVYVDDKLAGQLKFSLTKTTDGDPLVPKIGWKIEGPWKDYGYFKHKPDDGTRQDIFFVYWVAQHELKPGEKTVTASVRQGSKVVLKSRDAIPNGLPYSRFEVPVLKMDNNPLNVKDLDKLSGDFTVEVKAGTRVLRTWPLKFSGGALVPHRRSDHLKTGPLEWLSPRVVNGNSVSPFIHTWVGP